MVAGTFCPRSGTKTGTRLPAFAKATAGQALDFGTPGLRDFDQASLRSRICASVAAMTMAQTVMIESAMN
jgi:hypothetical protein